MSESDQTSNICPLCASSGNVFYNKKNRLYYECSQCSGIFVDRTLWLSKHEEEERYLQHNNDVENTGYQKFVLPIVSAVLRDFIPNHEGLDFGAGTGPVITKLLSEQDYNIKLYDPFFHKAPELLKKTYDYLVVCEVIEHFNYPDKEFALLKQLLKPNGKMYCFTHLYDPSITFHNWYYMNDATHVFIYQKATIDWIKKEFGFSEVSIEEKLITFSV